MKANHVLLLHHGGKQTHSDKAETIFQKKRGTMLGKYYFSDQLAI